MFFILILNRNNFRWLTFLCKNKYYFLFILLFIILKMKLGFDFGGSLIKISLSYNKKEKLSKEVLELFNKNSITHEFVKDEIVYINMIIIKKNKEDFFLLLKLLEGDLDQKIIYGTGGGAISYTETIKKFIKKKDLEIINEFKSIVNGIKSLKTIFPNFIYKLKKEKIQEKINKKIMHEKKKEYISIENVYPFLLVNIGTGISISLVTSENVTYTSGTALGGESFSGFVKQFYSNLDYFEIMKKMDKFYQENYLKDKECNFMDKNLKNSFSKNKNDEEYYKLNLIFGFFFSILNNICLISNKLAKNKKINHVLFIGNFLKNNISSEIIITDLYSKLNEKNNFHSTPLFLEIEGFLGSFYCLNKTY